MSGQPVGRDQTDAVHRSMGAGGREEAGGDETVHVGQRQAGIGDGRSGRLGRQGPQRRVRVPLHLTLGIADDGHPVARCHPPAHGVPSKGKGGHRDARSDVLEDHADRRDRGCSGAAGPSTSRPISRRSVWDRQLHVHQDEGRVEARKERLTHGRPGPIRPDPSTGTNSKAGIARAAVGADSSGRMGEQATGTAASRRRVRAQPPRPRMCEIARREPAPGGPSRSKDDPRPLASPMSSQP